MSVINFGSKELNSPNSNVLFSFVGFILYAFAVINCSHVVNYVLGPVCCPSESPNLLRLFGTPNIGVCDIQYDI